MQVTLSYLHPPLPHYSFNSHQLMSILSIYFCSLELPRISSNKIHVQHINTSSDIQLDGTQLKTTIEAKYLGLVQHTSCTPRLCTIKQINDRGCNVQAGLWHIQAYCRQPHIKQAGVQIQ